MTTIRDQLELHATACRAALAAGKPRPPCPVTYLEGASLAGAYLTRASLKGANLEGAYLEGAILKEANLKEAYLVGANLEGANLKGAYLTRASLKGANLKGAYLTRASLEEANLEGANLEGAYLERAILEGATLPDGRTINQWRSDPLAGLCSDPVAVERATAAWGAHTWTDCPMHAAHGWSSIADAPADQRLLAATFVALFDGGHLPKPPTPSVTP